MVAAPPPALTPLPQPAGAAPARDAARDAALWTAAQDLETAFLTEMLAAAGLGSPRDSFGGGAGEAQFASFLRREQAGAMVQSGGIGLAESLYEALKTGGSDHV